MGNNNKVRESLKELIKKEEQRQSTEKEISLTDLRKAQEETETIIKEARKKVAYKIVQRIAIVLDRKIKLEDQLSEEDQQIIAAEFRKDLVINYAVIKSWKTVRDALLSLLEIQYHQQIHVFI